MSAAERLFKDIAAYCRQTTLDTAKEVGIPDEEGDRLAALGDDIIGRFAAKAEELEVRRPVAFEYPAFINPRLREPAEDRNAFHVKALMALVIYRYRQGCIEPAYRHLLEADIKHYLDAVFPE